MSKQKQKQKFPAYGIISLIIFFGLAIVGSLHPEDNKQQGSSGSCKEAVGKIYTGVQLYEDSDCMKPLAIVLGGGRMLTGNDGLILRYPNGEENWKNRDAVRDQTYVKDDDPSIARREWRTVNE